MTHDCPACGLEHEEAVIVAEEAAAEAAVTEEVADAAVQIAQIEADRDVTLAKIEAKSEESEDRQRIAALEGRLAGIDETLARLVPEPDPEPAEPVVVVDAAPDPEPEPAEVPPDITDSSPGPKRKANPWWG